MPIPSTPDIAQALLQFLADGQEHHRQEILNALAAHFNLTPAEREEETPSGRNRFENLFAGAIHHLQQRERIESPRRTYWKITTEAFMAMAASFDSEQIREGSESDTAASISAVAAGGNPVEDNLAQTAEESIEENYQQIQDALAADLLEKIKSKSPAFFEGLVIDLLVAMDYGGSREDAEAVGRSGDGGIDGIINEDRLGLDVVYVQAKRWEGNVSRPEIQKFAGALQGRRARKGVFITTSDFTREARDYVTAIDSKIVLIDGHQLAQFMIDYNVGVSVAKSYEIKRVDSDYFAEEGE